MTPSHLVASRSLTAVRSKLGESTTPSHLVALAQFDRCPSEVGRVDAPLRSHGDNPSAARLRLERLTAHVGTQRRWWGEKTSRKRGREPAPCRIKQGIELKGGGHFLQVR